MVEVIFRTLVHPKIKLYLPPSYFQSWEERSHATLAYTVPYGADRVSIGNYKVHIIWHVNVIIILIPKPVRWLEQFEKLEKQKKYQF